MKKWTFWALMCAAALIHSASFIQGTRQIFEMDFPAVLNLTILLAVPVFWLLAAMFLVLFLLWTRWMGRNWMGEGCRFTLGAVLCRFRQSRRTLAWGMAFLLMTGGLVWLGLPSLLRANRWLILYVLSGLAALFLFFLWLQAAGERGMVVVQLMCALLVCALWLALAAGYAASAPWRTAGDPDPDLVVYNSSSAGIGRITASTQLEMHSVTMADGDPLERGESYGFFFVDGGRATVELWDMEGTLAGRCQAQLGEQRVYVTLDEQGELTIGTAAPWWR